MNMQEIEENNKAQVKAQKDAIKKFLAGMTLLTAQYGIELWANNGICLTDPEENAKGFHTTWAAGIHYRGKSEGYVIRTWHPDFIKNKEGK